MVQNGRKGGGRRKKAASTTRSTITFDYIKSNHFRVIQVDGIVGGIAPSGAIHMAIWNQRQPYPRQVVHELSPEGELGKEIGRASREGDLVWEIEAGLVFSPAMARAFVRWLEERLSELKAHDESVAGTKPQPEAET